jgi:hypothetical protein
LPLPAHTGEDRRRSGPVSVWWNLHQRSNQPQQSLLLRARPFSQEDADINV